MISGTSISEPFIQTSWERCSPKMNPNNPPLPSRVSADYFEKIKSGSFELMTIAQPIVEDMYQFVENSNTIFVLTNSAGYVLLIWGDRMMVDSAAELGITPGALLSEGVIGTNSIGLTLVERFPTAVVGPQHFLPHFHGLADAAAPIFDLSGRALGVVAAMTLNENYHPHTLGLVTAGARAIEAQRQSDQLLEKQNESLAELNAILETVSDGIIVWDSDRSLVHANHAALKIFGIPRYHRLQGFVNTNLPFPKIIQDAVDENRILSDVEVHFEWHNSSIYCIVSLQYIRIKEHLDWVVLSLRKAEEVRQIVQQQTGTQVAVSIEDFVGESKPIRELRRTARQIAPTKLSVLIRGEEGTGKDYLARALHNSRVNRDQPFVIFNCASVPSGLMLSELIGFEDDLSQSGSRPGKFELANSGTLFFQHVEALSLETQSVLLNALELGIIHRLGSARPFELDVRVIASTDVNLEKLVAQGSFRGDLFYRLSPFEIRLPPLRDRRGDIPYIVNRLLSRLERQHGQPIKLAPGLIEILQRYYWPGNVRELEATLERASLMALDEGLVTSLHLPEHIRNPVRSPQVETVSDPFQIQTLGEMEREAIIKAARACHGNVTQMATLLGIGRTTMWRKLKKLSISPNQFRDRKSPHIVS